MTMGIAHQEEGISVLDGVWEVRSPFDPQQVAEEFSTRLKQYGITRAYGDRYAGIWVADAFAMHGITYEPSELDKSQLYESLLPLLNSRTCALVDSERLRRQLLSLERRTGRGRDSIDHPKGQHDDLANACAGALVLCKHEPTAAGIPGFNRKLELPAMGVA